MLDVDVEEWKLTHPDSEITKVREPNNPTGTNPSRRIKHHSATMQSTKFRNSNCRPRKTTAPVCIAIASTNNPLPGSAI